MEDIKENIFLQVTTFNACGSFICCFSNSRFQEERLYYQSLVIINNLSHCVAITVVIRLFQLFS